LNGTDTGTTWQRISSDNALMKLIEVGLFNWQEGVVQQKG
jgi:hypothetical protein